MPKKKEQVEKPKVATPSYSLEIRVNDVEFKTKAKSLAEAFTKFVESPEFPLGAKTTAFVKYSKGKNVRSKIWHTPEARRVFRAISHKPTVLEVLAAKLEEDVA